MRQWRDRPLLPYPHRHPLPTQIQHWAPLAVKNRLLDQFKVIMSVCLELYSIEPHWSAISKLLSCWRRIYVPNSRDSLSKVCLWQQINSVIKSLTWSFHWNLLVPMWWDEILPILRESDVVQRADTVRLQHPTEDMTNQPITANCLRIVEW